MAYHSTKHVAFGGPNEHVTMGDVLDLEYNQAFSVSCWFKTTTGSDMVLVGKRDGTDKGWWLALTSAGEANAGMANTPTTDGLNIKTTATGFDDGEWHHFVWTKSTSAASGGSKIYIDGSSEALTVVWDTLASSTVNTGPMELGVDNAASFWYTGALDEVAIHDKELSAAEVTAIYNSGVPTDLAALSTASNLIAWWKLGEGDTFPTLQDSGVAGTNLACEDQTTSGNDGTPTNMESGDVSSDVAGGRASSFNGSDEHVSMGNVLDFERTDAFSWSFWINADDFAAVYMVVSKCAGTTTYRGYEISISTSGQVYFSLFNDFGSTNHIQVHTTNTVLSAGVWSHVTVTYDGTSAASGITIYVGGTSQSLTTDQDSLSATISTTADLNLARRSTDATNYFKGDLDDVAAYDKELSDAEITAIYNSGSPADLRDLSSASDLVGYWRMGDGATSPTIPDVLPQYSPLSTSINIATGGGGDQNEAPVFPDPLACPATGQAFSMGVWCKGTTTNRCMIGKSRTTSGRSWGLYAVHTPARVEVSWTDNDYDRSYSIFSPSSSILDGSWHHVVWTYDGVSTHKVYVDGSSISSGGGGSESGGMSGTSSAGELCAGGVYSGPTSIIDSWYQGRLCHSFLYDKELSAAEVTTLYGGGLPQNLSLVGPTSNLKHWAANGDGDALGSGNMVDLSGEDNHGTFINGESNDFVADVPSTTGNDGTTTNMDATNFVDGVPGGFSYASFDFGGTDEYVTMGDVLDFEYTSPFSISVWFKTTTTDIILLSKEDTTNYRGYEVGLQNALSNSFYFVLRNDNSPSNQITVHGDTTGLNDGKWHHAAVTWKGDPTPDATTDVELYVDGVQQSLTVIDNTLTGTTLNAASFNIGARNDGTDGWWVGKVDQVLIYDVELTSGQVSDLYGFGAPVDPTGLDSWSDAVGYWRMGEDSFDGTMTNMEELDIVEGDGPGWEWGSIIRRHEQQQPVLPIRRPSQDVSQARGEYPDRDLVYETILFGLSTMRRPNYLTEDQLTAPIVPPGGGGVTVTHYYRMRGVDDGTGTYTTWTAQDDPDPNGTQANAGNTTPTLVGSIVAGSGVTLHTWRQES